MCTIGQSECRPTSVPPTSLCDLVVQNSASHPVSLAKVAPVGRIANLHWSPVVMGLVGPSASLALPAGGCLLAFDHPSMFPFFIVCLDKNAGDDVQSMGEEYFLADSDISMTTAGSHSLLSHQCHDITLATKHQSLDPCQYTKGRQFSVLLTVRRRTGYHLTVTGDAFCKNWKKYVIIRCVDRHANSEAGDALPLSQHECERDVGTLDV